MNEFRKKALWVLKTRVEWLEAASRMAESDMSLLGPDAALVSQTFAAAARLIDGVRDCLEYGQEFLVDDRDVMQAAPPASSPSIPDEPAGGETRL